jgi:hypothetical protein
MPLRTSGWALSLWAGGSLLLSVSSGPAQQTQLLKDEGAAPVWTLAGTGQDQTILTAGRVSGHGVPVRVSAPARVVVSTHTRVVTPVHSAVFAPAHTRVVVPAHTSVFVPAHTRVFVGAPFWTVPRTTVIVSAGWWRPWWHGWWGPVGWWYPWRGWWWRSVWWPPIVVAPTYYYPWWCYPSTYSYPMPTPVIASSASYYSPGTWQPGVLPPAAVFSPAPDPAPPDRSGGAPGNPKDTYDYDGGPSQPVPLPQPSPGTSTDTQNTAGAVRPTSWPTPSRPRFTYPAYGEPIPRRTPPASNTLLLAQPQPRR